MQSSIRVGLVAGAVGLVLVVIGSAFSGYCALALPLVISGAAGYSSARRAKPVSKGYGARIGSLAGIVSGGIVFHAGMISQTIMAAVIRNAPAYLGYIVESNPLDATERIFLYLIGLVWAALIGGIVGAVAGYLGTSSEQATSHTAIK